MPNDTQFLLNSVDTEIIRLEELLDEHEADLSDDTYNALNDQLNKAIELKSMLNGIDALQTIEAMGNPLSNIQTTTAKINDSVATLENVEKYLGLVASLLEMAQGVVSSNPNITTGALAKALTLLEEG